MTLKLLLIFFIPLHVLAQDITEERRVMRLHPNGKEYVVLYFHKESGELIKEEVFYSNGHLQWSGSYKGGKEHGKWEFYFENGKVKTSENYINGREHGTSTEYDATGKKLKDSYWKYGKLIKEVKYT